MAGEPPIPLYASHVPVLLDPILDAIQPVSGIWLDGTFGAGGYSRALLEAGATRVLAVDRDPSVFQSAKSWAWEYGERLSLIEGQFGDLADLAAANGAAELDGVVLDIGVSSMQIDEADRGFSFQANGPLDMRMSKSGPSAADLVNGLEEAVLADILFQYGEERASRRIARHIVAARQTALISTTAQLVALIEEVLPRGKPGMAHPATRSFQALRIAVNDELRQLVEGLFGAEQALRTGGVLAVVTFHSLEDRIVKRFLQARSGAAPKASRYQPEQQSAPAQFERLTRKAIGPDAAELAANPRSRSAKLRLARRTDAPMGPRDLKGWGLPRIALGERP